MTTVIPVPSSSVGQPRLCPVPPMPSTDAVGLPGSPPSATLPPRERSRAPSPVRVVPDHDHSLGGMAVEPPRSLSSAEPGRLSGDDLRLLLQQKTEEVEALIQSYRELDRALFPLNDPQALLKIHAARPQHAELFRIVLRLHELQTELGEMQVSASALQ